MLITSYHDYPKSLMLKTTDELVEAFPEFKDIGQRDLELLLKFRNMVRITVLVIPPYRNRDRIWAIASRLEGSRNEYVRGSGQRKQVDWRMLVFEKEGAGEAEQRPWQRGKRKNKDEPDQLQGSNVPPMCVPTELPLGSNPVLSAKLDELQIHKKYKTQAGHIPAPIKSSMIPNHLQSMPLCKSSGMYSAATIPPPPPVPRAREAWEPVNPLGATTAPTEPSNFSTTSSTSGAYGGYKSAAGMIMSAQRPRPLTAADAAAAQSMLLNRNNTTGSAGQSVGAVAPTSGSVGASGLSRATGVTGATGATGVGGGMGGTGVGGGMGGTGVGGVAGVTGATGVAGGVGGVGVGGGVGGAGVGGGMGGAGVEGVTGVTGATGVGGGVGGTGVAGGMGGTGVAWTKGLTGFAGAGTLYTTGVTGTSSGTTGAAGAAEATWRKAGLGPNGAPAFDFMRGMLPHGSAEISGPTSHLIDIQIAQSLVNLGKHKYSRNEPFQPQ